ncbi:MAG TPA: ADOP family duplicated permease [Acidobacteriota bacterium]|nr:ADOP family duplicated permease [Acidobacteriota bacterium]
MRVKLKHRRLARELARSRLSQNGWARKLGLSRGHLSNLVNGNRPYPGASTRKKLLETLDLDFEELFEIEVKGGAEAAPGRSTRRRPARRGRPSGSGFQGLPGRPRTPTRKGAEMQSIKQDIHYAWRLLRRNPGFTAVAVLTLALGIGANTAIFSAVNAILLSDPPYPDPDRLVVLQVDTQDLQRWSYPLFEDFRERAGQTLPSMAAYTRSTRAYSLSGGEIPQKVEVEFVSAGYFPVLGVEAAEGRTFADDEDRTPGSHPVALISRGLRQRIFGTEEDAVGRTITLNSVALTVVGVMPEGFRGLSGTAEVWTPMMMAPRLMFARRLTVPFAFWHDVVARVPHGWTPQRLQSALDAAAAGTDEQFRFEQVFEGQSLEVKPVSLAQAQTDPALRAPLLILSAAVGFVLLIACANLAHLLMARSARRRREIGLRKALGAGRPRLVRQLLTENLLLSLAGGVLALFFAQGGMALLTALRPPVLEGTRALDSQAVGLDPAVLAFNFLLALAAALLFGLLPALRSSRTEVAGELKTSRTGWSLTGGRSAWGSLLVVGELALAMVLLAGAGLLVRSLDRLHAQPLGFEPQGRLAVQISLPSQAYSAEAAADFFQRLLEQASALPQVRSAALGNCLPVRGGCDQTSLRIQGLSEEEAQQRRTVWVQMVDENYLQTLGIGLQAGRGLESADRRGAPFAALVNETAARTFWTGQDPIGKRIRPAIGLPEGEFAEVVGIVADVKDSGLASPPQPGVYLSFRQISYRSNYLILHSAGEAAGVAGAVRALVREMDPDLPIWDVRSMQQHIADDAASTRFSTVLLGTFALLALCLAAVGVYGVLAYAVSGRTREFAVRLALGARRGELLRLVLVQGLFLTAAGLALGLGGTLALTRLMSSLLFQVSPTDPLTLAMGMAVLAAAALAACLRPALRAIRTDPMQTLRYE